MLEKANFYQRRAKKSNNREKKNPKWTQIQCLFSAITVSQYVKCYYKTNQ